MNVLEALGPAASLFALFAAYVWFARLFERQFNRFMDKRRARHLKREMEKYHADTRKGGCGPCQP